MASAGASRAAALLRDEQAADFTVIIPAHNEAQVIARCLRGITDTCPDGLLPDIIVAANGCSDDTSKRAREAAPMATVIDLDQASKPAAINHAVVRAKRYPLLVMDADVESDFHSLSQVAKTLREGPCQAASPRMRIRLDGCSAGVKAYYAIWTRLPYAKAGLIGGGVYGVSRQGATRVFPLPDIIGDDLYVRTRFASHERCNIAEDVNAEPVFVTMVPPTNLRDLIAIEARRRLGKHEVDCRFPTDESGSINRWTDLVAVPGTVKQWCALFVYIGVKLAAYGRYRLNLLRGKADWARDPSSRGDVAPDSPGGLH